LILRHVIPSPTSRKLLRVRDWFGGVANPRCLVGGGSESLR
jgi:hypothetical protein